MIAVFTLVTSVGGFPRKMEKDTDKDGRIDRVVYFDEKGKIKRLEADSNQDGSMDRFQYYKEESLVRLERDLDDDGRIDCRDFFENGKRVRQERLDQEKAVFQVTTFDGQER